SIAARLTLLYTLGAMAAVALFAGLVDWKLADNFEIEHLRFLQAKAAELEADLDDASGDPHSLLAEILKETAGTRLRQYQARVLAGSQLLGQTPGMARTLPPARFPPPAAGALTRADLRPLTASGHRWLLASLPLRSAGGPLTVQLALDVSRDDALIAEFHRALAVFFLLLVPLLVLAGRWVSARALAPLSRIARAAEAVTPARLAARIPETLSWPRELVGLVDTFNIMLARLEEAFGRLSRFSADLAHELRTPLSNLRGELEVCLARPRSAAEYRATLESGLENCRRLGALIENLLFLARAERADLALKRERFATAEAAGWVIAQHASSAAARGVRIEFRGAAEVVADPLLFRQALSNVLANAVRHAPPGSTVTVGLEPLDGGVKIYVTNRGKGIAPEHLAHIFERFYRADPARDRGGENVSQGSGLGLSIVRSILELHGGHVSIASRPSVGTTVTLYFPAATE
ncbi:MAG: heavy metal sensor histidine kinase, partial [Gammaproteobacteria bacterium]|nr:heavy metal sensor histidine kinase [Gammaproteobacteria bacterium]